MRIVIAFAIALCLLTAGLGFTQTNDVPQGHWAYAAVQDLANKGYVLGYPDGNFLGNRTLTRYEFATVIKRVLDNLPSPAAAPSPAATTQQPIPQGVTQADLDEINKLVNEFKVELTVIGTRLDKVESDMADVQKRLGTVEEITMGGEGAVEATKADVAKLKKVTVSGYVQARFESFPDNVDEDGKTFVSNTFNVRRARVKVTAKPSDYTTGVLQLDMGGDKPAVKDAYASYAFSGNPDTGSSFTIGQMNWPFGYEVPYSSSKRETPERALWSRRFFPGERDRGAMFKYPFGKTWFVQAGAFDGTGIDTVNSVTTVVTDSTTTPPTTTKIKIGSAPARDYNNNKDVIVNVQDIAENYELGFSAYLGKGIWNPDRAAMVNVDKIRYGADFRYYWQNLTLKTEFVQAKGVDQAVSGFDNSKWITAYDAQLGFNLSSKDTLVARYESMSQDPLFPAFGRRSAWNLGVLRWLDDRTRVKLFYQMNQEQSAPVDNNIWRFEWLMTY